MDIFFVEAKKKRLISPMSGKEKEKKKGAKPYF
jgi:hypothetical protein